MATPSDGTHFEELVLLDVKENPNDNPINPAQVKDDPTPTKISSKDEEIVEKPVSKTSDSKEMVRQPSQPGRKRRASVVTKLIGNLHRESQAKASWVVGLLFFKTDAGFNNLRDTVGRRLLEIPRFRSKLVAKRFPSRLDFVEVDENDIDMGYHFRQLFADRVVSLQELDDFAGRLFENFDHPKENPLWQISYIPRLEDGRACMITNISHIIGDGISQVEVLLRLLDKPEEGEMRQSETLKAPAKRPPPPFGPLTKARIFLGGVMEGLFAVVTPPDGSSSLRLKNMNKPSSTKLCCFSETIDLDRVKEIKNVYEGATLNDILVTLLTLTLRAYFLENDPTTIKKKVRAQFPINTRSKRQGAFRGEDPRNAFAYGFMPFHISHKGDQSSLVWKTKRTLDKIKHSPSPHIQQKMGAALSNVMPLKTMNTTVLNVAAKATAQVSNVPGPQCEASIGGTPIDDMRFLLHSPLAFYLGLLTYNGKLSASFCVDSTLPDPKLLAKHWLPEFEKFYAHAKAEAEKSGGLIKKPKSWKTSI